MSIERSFIDGVGLPSRPQYKNILLAPSSFDVYHGTTLAGLYDLLWSYQTDDNPIQKQKIVNDIRKYLSVLTFHINEAKMSVKQTFT